MAFEEIEAEHWLNDAHHEMEGAFEGTIRDPLREQFGIEEDA